MAKNLVRFIQEWKVVTKRAILLQRLYNFAATPVYFAATPVNFSHELIDGGPTNEIW